MELPLLGFSVSGVGSRGVGQGRIGLRARRARTPGALLALQGCSPVEALGEGLKVRGLHRFNPTFQYPVRPLHLAVVGRTIGAVVDDVKASPHQPKRQRLRHVVAMSPGWAIIDPQRLRRPPSSKGISEGGLNLLNRHRFKDVLGEKRGSPAPHHCVHQSGIAN